MWISLWVLLITYEKLGEIRQDLVSLRNKFFFDDFFLLKQSQ